METIYSKFKESVKRYPDSEALATLNNGTYEITTYKDLNNKVLNLAGDLSANTSKSDNIALMVENSPAWVITDLACAHLGLVVVPVHTTYNSEYLEYIISHSESEVIIIDKALYEKHQEEINRLNLRRIYIVGDEAKGNKDVESFNSIIEDEIKNVEKKSDIKYDDIHTIVYTSGTTGRPKGVMLTHENLVSNAMAAKKHIPIASKDRFFSFLPLSHVFERTAGYYVPVFSGAAIYYARSAKTIIEDIGIAQPTILVCVPRVFERIHEKIRSKFSKNALLKKIFSHAQQTAIKNEGGLLYRIYDKIIYTKVRNLFGGRLRFAVSGSASLSKHIAVFFKGLGITVLEGYGLTETSPIVTANKLDKYKLGTVGTTFKDISIKISGNGEILIKGPCVMKGYYKADGLTDEIIDKDGWLHTGDLGLLDNEGFLTIIGRLKEMIVLSTGRNIFPVPIEQQLEESVYIKQAMVYGDNHRHLSALIVPNFVEVKKWSSENNAAYKLPEVLGLDKINKLYSREIQNSLRGMQSFEKISNFILLNEEFSVKDGALTPTQKLKRYFIYNKYISSN